MPNYLRNTSTPYPIVLRAWPFMRDPVLIEQVSNDWLSISEEALFTTNVTMHPIEGGGNVTDHIYQNPIELTITGRVTNYIIKKYEDYDEAPDYVQDLYTQLRLLWLSRTVVQVQTQLATYTNMVMTSFVPLPITRRGDAFDFKASFREVRFVSAESTTIPVDLLPPERAFNPNINGTITRDDDQVDGAQAQKSDQSKPEANGGETNTEPPPRRSTLATLGGL